MTAPQCRYNVMEQRAWRLSLLHWQHSNLAKVFQRWKEYKGRRAELFSRMLGLACKWERPLLEDAWTAWLQHAAQGRQDKVQLYPMPWPWLVPSACHSNTTAALALTCQHSRLADAQMHRLQHTALRRQDHCVDQVSWSVSRISGPRAVLVPIICLLWLSNE